MNTHLKRTLLILGAAVALAGCSLIDTLTKKETSSTVDSTPTPTSAQTETTTTTEMGSPSYKVDSAVPATTPTTKTTTEKSDDPEDLQKDLDSVSIKSDFGALVE